MPQRPVLRKMCGSCGRTFAAKNLIDGMRRSLYGRRFCLDCSPFGAHNTSKFPLGIAIPDDVQEYRRRRRNQGQYRYQKKRRKSLKAELLAARGGRCEECGYDLAIAALEFHHRDPTTKEFGIGSFGRSRDRLIAEAQKCDLICANCHRRRHASLDAGGNAVVRHRRARKARLVRYMGGACQGCGVEHALTVLEFHHLDARQKDFGMSENGIPHSWAKSIAELAKCVMLCANCHREVHAGVREIDEGLLGLAEPPGVYRAA